MGEQPDAVQLVCERGGKGKAKVSALRNGETVHLDDLNLNNAAARSRFGKDLCKKLPAADPEAIEAELLRLAAAPPPEGALAGESDGDTAAAMLDTMPKDIRDDAAAMLADPNLIQTLLADVAALGVAGERELAATVYLIGTSRLLDRPLAGIVQGPSASGKSFVIERTAALFPPEAVVVATQMTPQALFHMKPDSLTHKFVVAGERSRLEDDERAEATRALREMLSAGRLSKLMPVKVEGGRIETQLIEQEGPIAFVESTTLSKVFDEDANRCILVHTDEQERQTARIIASLAASYSRGASPAGAERIVQRHHALQRLLRRQAIVIPFAGRLAELFPSDRVEARRAFPQLMSMIQAVTLLHQRQRDQDGDGRLLATADDYRLARRLLLKPMGRLLGGRLSDPARRFWERLWSKWATGPFTTTDAKRHETGSKSSVYGWLKELHEAGRVEMTNPPRGSSPATWRLADGGPGEGAALTLPEWDDVLSPCPARKRGHDAEPVAAL
jgi:hypothetical protein